ncbi:MAG: phosphatase PAP2 family protein [Eubacterium sp.]|nr:phosphatase PAP2 family protein [Eubacterium sp.]
MYKENYEKKADLIRKRPALLSLIKSANLLFTITGFTAYPLLLLLQFRKKGVKAVSYVIIPGTAFVLVSAARRMIGRKRPYESHEITPLIDKESTGNSFPSRHVFSLFLIAFLWISVSIPAAVCLTAAAVILAAIRVIAGVHYLSDVIAGAFLGIFSAVLTLFSASD